MIAGHCMESATRPVMGSMRQPQPPPPPPPPPLPLVAVGVGTVRVAVVDGRVVCVGGAGDVAVGVPPTMHRQFWSGTHTPGRICPPTCRRHPCPTLHTAPQESPAVGVGVAVPPTMHKQSWSGTHTPGRICPPTWRLHPCPVVHTAPQESPAVGVGLGWVGVGVGVNVAVKVPGVGEPCVGVTVGLGVGVSVPPTMHIQSRSGTHSPGWTPPSTSRRQPSPASHIAPQESPTVGVGVGPPPLSGLDTMKMSLTPLVSPSTRFVASDWKTMVVPSALICGKVLSPSPGCPEAVRLTSLMVLVVR